MKSSVSNELFLQMYAANPEAQKFLLPDEAEALERAEKITLKRTAKS